MSTEHLQKVRPCGRLETYSTARHHLGFYNNVGLTATYTTPVAFKGLLKHLVFATLHQVIAEHPNLCTIPVNEDKSFPDVYFARLPEIDLRTCVEFHTRNVPCAQGDESDEELDELLREQHSRNFMGSVEPRPYWRLIISSSPEAQETFSASWIFHHALSDGASSMLFHQSFLRCLNASTTLASISPIVKAPLSTVQPPLEELHPMTISWTYFIRAVAGSILPSFFAPRSPHLWTGSSIGAAAETTGSAHTITMFLPAKASNNFAAKCRSESTSVTAALSTLLAAVLTFHVAGYKYLSIDIPISLRPVLSVPNDQMVNAITSHTHTFSETFLFDCAYNPDVLTYFSWAMARELKGTLTSEVAKQGIDSPIALLRYVSDMHKFFTQKLGTERDSSAEVSNLGVWRDPSSSVNAASMENAAGNTASKKQAEWKMGRMVFSQSSNLTGPPISLSAVTGPDGCLALNFTWSKDDKSLQRVPSSMKEAILKLAK